MACQSGQTEVPQCHIDTAKNSFARDQPMTTDLQPGTFFADPNYLDSLPYMAKILICAIQDSGNHPNNPALCHHQSDRALNQYRQTGNDDLLTMAFAMEVMALWYVPAVHPGRGKSNHHLGLLYQTRWENKKAQNDLDEADDAVLCEWACDVAFVFWKHWELTKLDSDKEDAKQPSRARHLSNKGEFLYLTMSGSDSERVMSLTESIESHDEAQFAPYGMIYRNAAKAYIGRFRIAKMATDGDKGISLYEKALGQETPGNQSWLHFTAELANAYNLRFEVSGDPEQGEKACELWRKSITSDPTSITSRVTLAEFYRCKSEKCLDRGATEDLLGQALRLANDAFNVLPPGHSETGLVFRCFAAIYYSLYEASGELSLIDKAVECGRKATQAPDHDDLWDSHRLLAQILSTRYERLQKPEDMRACVSAATRALSLCPSDNSEHQGQCVWIMGKATRAEYDGSRKTELLSQAISKFSQADQLIHNDTSSKALVLNDLGNSYVQLFGHEARPEHLEKGIDAHKEALSVLQQTHKTDRHPNILMVNSALGNVMVQRFVHWRAEADIESAVKYCRRSLSGMDAHHPRHALRVGNLSAALQLRFQSKRNVDDLRETQDLLAEALDGSVPLSDGVKTMLATVMGNTYQLSYGVSEQSIDLENAIDYYSKGLAVGSAASAPLRGMALNHKAACLQLLAMSTGEIANFETCAKAYEESQGLLGKEDPVYWVPVMKHADLLYAMYELKLGSDFKEHARQALDKYDYVANLNIISPAIRITVACQAAELSSRVLQDRAKARNDILISLDLLPEAILMHATRLEQLKFVRQYESVPGMVAALSIDAGDPASTVIPRLEAGRAFIWDRVQGRETQLDEIQAIDPMLAERFRTLQQRVTQQSRAAGASGDLDLASVTVDDANRMQRQHDSDAYRLVLGDIRALPGFQSFLRIPDTTTDLQAYAADAPIVFINCSDYRSDALVITKDEVYNLPLPSFTLSKVQHWGQRFLQARESLSIPESQAWALDAYKVVMKWLWEAAAQPVLTSINWDRYERGPFGKPRVIWVSTGWISVLPIHAAGDFFEPSPSSESTGPRCVHDIAASSYTNSLKSLEFTRLNAQRMGLQPSSAPQALLAAMATTPGLGPEGDLAVEAEIATIKDTLSPTFTVNVSSQPTSKSIKAALPASTIAHFACHAVANSKDPSQSAILLQDNQTRPPPFCTRTILNLALKTCNLVYLSACESGANKDMLLLDEGIHIAGGFHIAGVPHVLSTLWKVQDSVSAELAGLFYGLLVETGREVVDFGRAPFAFHEAVGVMRRRGVHPMLWGPFVHSGP
ncbi:CHAT domain-containing protein [Aspergillus candidus]|uniref:CHAT domain-domain-containing protein n=1 Tax=Aspergillus candidus TaxID=41067 RepID=A0A2I2FAH1_ASPCN|nr:CHAT domain-domain-containing protein [Aspergillus candidus]PLB37618.1 CHAT domain-domain-containing protein [Aspergillus candidus]